MASKISSRVVLVSIALALFLWASFNILDLAVKTYTMEKSDVMFMLFGLAWFSTLAVLIYYGAYGRILQK